MEKRYSIKELKKIVNEIVEEEKQKQGLNVNVFPVTFIEYYTDYLFKGNFSLAKGFKQVLCPLVDRGFYFNGNIVVLFNRTKKIKKLGNSYHLFWFVNVIYHELRHIFQENVSGYERFLSNMEQYLQFARLDEFNYENDHDSFSFEIGANLYGIRRAKEYLIDKYPEAYELEKKQIIGFEERYMLDYFMYDASHIYDLAVPFIRGKLKMNPCPSVFMHSDGGFRKVRNILMDSVYNSLDERTVAAIMSSRTFLRELNFDNLSYDELKALGLIVNYTDTIYHNQLKYLEKLLNEKKISNKLYADKKSIVLKRIESLRPYLEDIDLYMSIARNIEDRKK